MKYKTNQSDKLNSFFRSHKDTLFSIEEAIEEIEGVGKSTVYRQFATAEKQGVIKRLESEKGVVLYQYIDIDECCNEHLHLVCKECGRFVHLDNKQTNELIQNLEESIGFEISSDTTFYGKCSECRNKK